MHVNLHKSVSRGHVGHCAEFLSIIAIWCNLLDFEHELETQEEPAIQRFYKIACSGVHATVEEVQTVGAAGEPHLIKELSVV